MFNGNTGPIPFTFINFSSSYLLMTITGVHPIQLTESKATLLNCNDKLILIDAGGSDNDAQKILRYARNNLTMTLEKHGVLCIITHHHIDHVGGLKRIREISNLQIASHLDEAEAIESATGLTVDLKLGDNEILPYCGGIQIIHVPGHTPGNICLYVQEKALLVVGDTLFADDEGNLMPPPDHYSLDPEMAKQELQRLRKFDFDSIIVSHGKDTMKNAKAAFNRLKT